MNTNDIKTVEDVVLAMIRDHELVQEDTKEWFKLMLQNNVSWDDVNLIVMDYLQSRGKKQNEQKNSL